jgi:prepilin-type N-terminal cleavage/methylation domain-containing protein
MIEMPMQLIHAARRRLGSERGWTLVELLITVALLTIVLTAVLSITDSVQRQASADDERSNTLSESQNGLTRLTRELRQACAIFFPASTPIPGQYCFDRFDNAPAPTACTRTSDCIDFVTRRRTSFTRSGSNVASISHPLVRVRWNCAVNDPASSGSNLARTECVRYENSCGTNVANACPSPTTQAGIPLRAVLNSGATGSPNNVFQYCIRRDPYTCDATPTQTINSTSSVLTSISAVKVSLRIARRGTRKATGTNTSFFLQDGVELKSITGDATPG